MNQFAEEIYQYASLRQRIVDKFKGFTPVSSSNVRSVKYSPETEEMRVRFLSGGTYIYSDVPEHVYKGMLDTPSKGRYIWSVIRPTYNYRRI